MEYPTELLPKANYKIIKTEELDKKQFLIRRSLVDGNNTFNTLGIVRSDAIALEPKDLYGLSNSLFGIFIEKHLQYKQKGASLDKWLPGNPVPLPHEIDFGLFDDAVPIYFKIIELHKSVFPYEKSEKNNQKTKELRGACLVVHKPVVANYWHFELSFIEENGSDIRRKDGTWREKAAYSFINLTLKIFALKKDEKPKITTIDPRIFQE